MIRNTVTNLYASGNSFEVLSVRPGSVTSLDINSANIVGTRNSSIQGYRLSCSEGNGAISVELDPTDATFNTTGATYTDEQINVFLEARNEGGRVLIPASLNALVDVKSVSLPS